MYKEKYLKYKTKYLDLKSQLGGAPASAPAAPTAASAPLEKTEEPLSLVDEKTNIILYSNDKPYSFIKYIFDEKEDKLTISYEDNESEYHLSIYFNKTFFQRMTEKQIEFKYGKRDKLKVVSIKNEHAINKLPYIVAFILFILIQSIKEIPKNIKGNSSNWIFKLNLLKENILNRIKGRLKMDAPVEIKYNNKTKKLTIIAVSSSMESGQAIILHFKERKIYKRYNDTIINKEGLPNDEILEGQRSINYDSAATYNILVNICIWLLELDYEKRMIFAINMGKKYSNAGYGTDDYNDKWWNIVDFKDENLEEHKEVLLNLLKNYSTLMKIRLTEFRFYD
jgi:hypothetical protein